MTAEVAELSLAELVERYTADSVALDFAIETLLSDAVNRPDALAQPSTPEAVSEEITRPLGATMLQGAEVVLLDDFIGAPGRANVAMRYHAMLQRVARHNIAVPKQSPPSTIEMLESADRGEQRGRDQLLMNVAPHTGEIFEQVGARLTVAGEVNTQGHIEQFGQTHEHRQELTLASYPDQDPALREAVHSEGVTAFSIEEGRRQLAGKKVVEMSAMTDEADAATLSGWGYFLENMTAIVRFNSVNGKRADTLSLLLGGVDPESVAPLPEEPTEADVQARQKHLLAARYDVRVFAKMRRHLDLKTPEHMTANEILADAIVIDEQFDEIDFAMLYDQFAAEEVAEGKRTFFGSVELWRELGEPEQLTREMYETRLREADARAAERKALNDHAVDLALARYRALSDYEKKHLRPVDASNILRKATLDATVYGAVTKYQDAKLSNLGSETWESIQDGRVKWNEGDIAGAQKDIEHGQDTAIDPACPTGPNSRTATAGGEEGADRDKLGSRYFRCPNGHLNYRRVANVPETHCHVCRISVGCEPDKVPNVSAGRTTKASIKQERYGKVRTSAGWLVLAKA